MQLVDSRTPEVKALAKYIKSAMHSLVDTKINLQDAGNTLGSVSRSAGGDALDILISAPAGMGKTNFSQAIVRDMKHDVTHPEADKRPVLFIKSPSSSVRGGMIHLLLEALEDHSPNKGNLEEKLDRINHYIKRQNAAGLKEDAPHLQHQLK